MEGYSPIAGATVMKLESSTFSETTGNLTMYFKNATSIEAGKPYIVRWDEAIAGNIQNPVFLNATVSTTLTRTETQWVNFIGSTSQVSIAEEDRTLLYLGAKNKLVYPSGAMTFGACRAYFQLKGLEVKPSDPSSDPTETGINIVMDFEAPRPPSRLSNLTSATERTAPLRCGTRWMAAASAESLPPRVSISTPAGKWSSDTAGKHAR